MEDVRIYDVQDVVYAKTRATSECNLSVTGWKIDDYGKLAVTLHLEGSPATGDQITRYALNVIDKNGRSVLSDYATLAEKSFNQFFIASKIPFEGEHQYPHFRRGTDDVTISDQESTVQADYYEWVNKNDKEVWHETANLPESIQYSDFECEYDKTADLNELVTVHYLDNGGQDCVDMNAAKLATLGFKLKFEVVKNFAWGDPATDQADFVELVDGHVFTPKTYSTVGTSCIGRSPIIRATIVDANGNVVRAAYIRFTITRKAQNFEITVPDFEDFLDGQANETTVEQMNTIIYNAMGMSKVEFHALFNQFEDYDFMYNPDWVGHVNDIRIQDNLTTHVLQWILDDDEIWNNPDTDISHKVCYKSENGDCVYVTLKSHIKDITKVFEVADYVTNYWDAAKKYTFFNVSVPDQTDDQWDQPEKCTFVTNVNTPFQTWPANATDGVPGMLKFKSITPKNNIESEKLISKVKYFFSADEVAELNLKVNGEDVVFEVSSDNTELYAKTASYPQMMVAYINNNTAEADQIMTYVKSENNDNIVSALLNAGKDYATTCVKASGYLNARDDRNVDIAFGSIDNLFFNVKFLRPVNMGEKAGGEFTDGVNFGAAGSFVTLESFLNPTDWRGFEFGPFDLNAHNYWYYYGTRNLSPMFWDIDILVDQAKVKLNGQWVDLPTTFELNQKDPSEFTPTSGDTSDFGYVTYKNNGARLTEEAAIKVPVKVQYGWGVYVTDYIEIAVKPTIGQ